MALSSAFLYALSNILQEHFLKDRRDINHYLGWLGVFGSVITAIEAYIFDEYSKLRTIDPVHEKTVILNLGCFMVLNFICYSAIPFYVQRSGATLLNISNVTTVIWSMLSDILIFKKKFYILYVAAFVLEMAGIVIFSVAQEQKDRLNEEQKIN